MAISRVKNWVSAEVLYASDLNSEFNNILNNALSLVSPWTANMDAGGFRLITLALGTVGSPALQFTGDTNTGVYSAGADSLDLSVGGLQGLNITTTSSTPYAAVQGGLSVGGTWQPGFAILNDTDTGLASITAGTLDLVANGARVVQASAFADATNYLIIRPGKTGDSVQLSLGGTGQKDIALATGFIPASITAAAASGTMSQHGLYRENVPKGWIIFKGSSTASIYDSFNVTSLGRNATGDYTLTWSRAFTASPYALTGTASDNTADGAARILHFAASASQPANPFTTTTTRLQVRDITNTAQDAELVSVIAIGKQ